MELKIKIKTPKGHAKVTSERLDFRKFILGFRTKTKESYVNKDNSEIVWVLDVPVRKAISIQRRIASYGVMLKAVLGNPVVKKVMQPGQEKELDLLLQETKIEVIKNATAQELVEANTTWWDKIHTTWKKI